MTIDDPTFDIFQHLLEAGTVEIHTGITIIHIDFTDIVPIAGAVICEDRPLRTDTQAFALPFVVLGQPKIKPCVVSFVVLHTRTSFLNFVAMPLYNESKKYAHLLPGGHCVSIGGKAGGGVLNRGENAVVIIEIGDGITVLIGLLRQTALVIVCVLYTITVTPVPGGVAPSGRLRISD